MQKTCPKYECAVAVGRKMEQADAGPTAPTRQRLKNLSQLKAEAQTEFNRNIGLRDNGLPVYCAVGTMPARITREIFDHRGTPRSLVRASERAFAVCAMQRHLSGPLSIPQGWSLHTAASG